MSRNHISLVIIGHADSGKDTITGHLLYRLGGIDPRTIAKFDREAAACGKFSFRYNWMLEKRKTDREPGYVVDISPRKVETRNHVVSIINAPGPRNVIKNVIAAAAHADCALLVVDATTGAFECGNSKDGQTREHALLAFAMGVKHMIVVVSKMDDGSVAFSRARYEEIREHVSTYLKRVGYDPAKVPIVPVSAWNGDNMTDMSLCMPWWTGGTLLDALEAIPAPQASADKPLRITLREVHKIGGIGTVPEGRVEAGVLRVDQQVTFAARGIDPKEVLSIEMHHSPLTEARAGDFVGFNIRGVSAKDLRRGLVVGDARDNPPAESLEFTAQVIIVTPNTRVSRGYTPLLFCHTAHAPCKFELLLHKVDRRSGSLVEKDPETLKTGDAALVLLVPQRPICVESYVEYPRLGRIVLRDSNRTVAVGVVRTVWCKGSRGWRLDAVAHRAAPHWKRRQVVAMLSLAAREMDGQPRYPAAQLWRLPLELVELCLLERLLSGDVY